MVERLSPGWTLDTAVIHLEAKITAQGALFDTRLLDQAKAVEVALSDARRSSDRAQATADDRSAQQNEWRATLIDLSRDMLPRAEYNRAHTDLDGRVQTLGSRIEKLEGQKTGSATTITLVLSIIATLLAAGSALSAYVLEGHATLH